MNTTKKDRERALELVAKLRGSTPERTEAHAKERPTGNTAAMIGLVAEALASERERASVLALVYAYHTMSEDMARQIVEYAKDPDGDEMPVITFVRAILRGDK